MSDPYRDLDKQWDDRGLKAYGSFTEHPIKWVVTGFLALLALIVLISVIHAAFSTTNVFWQGERAKITAPARVEQLTYDPANIAAQKAYFTSACNDVGADVSVWKVNEQNVTQLEAQIKAGIVQDPTGSTLQQVEAQAQGPQAAVYTAAADYNAHAQNSIYKPFLPSGFPTSITPPASIAALATWVPPHCG
jgi:hypothetical protein